MENKETQIENIELQEEQAVNIPLDFSSLQSQVWNEMSNYLNINKGRKYSKEDIDKFLENPKRYEKQLRDASINLYNTSGHYSSLISYLSRMLTLDYIITPVGIAKKEVKTKVFKENYKKAENYTGDFNIKHELNKVLITMVSEDVYFGYERKVGRSSTLQRLPSDYCEITGMEAGLYTFSFDMSYFNNDKSKLRNFDKEFAQLYEVYQNTKVSLQPLNTNKAVCLKFREDIINALPPFAMVFGDILDLEDSKDLVKTKNILENFKLLLQKIPFKKEPKTEKDFLMTLDSVKMFHNSIKTVLPEQIGLITSPMEIEDFSFERKNNAIADNLKESKEGFYDSAGISSSLFNAGSKSSIAIIKALQSNESMMFGILRQFERFFKRRLGQVVGGEGYSFELIFPDLTVYNRDEMFERYLKMAQFGYPKSFVGASVGLSSSQLEGLNLLENEHLKLTETLIPLQSSHTMSEKDKAGAKEKKDGELSEKGIETRDDGTNKIAKETKK